MANPLDEFKRPYTYRRPASDSLDSATAFRVPGSLSEPVSFYASIQPLTGLQLLLLPEGMRNRATVRVYTETELQVANEATQVKGDRVQFKGRDWEVQRQEDWSDTDLPYYKFFAQMVEVGAIAPAGT